MADTNEARTMKKARILGYMCDRCDRYNAFSQRRGDMFGVFDCVAVGHNEIIGIQTTSLDNHASRRNKINASAAARKWLTLGGPSAAIEIWSWGIVKGKYELKRERVNGL